MIKVIPSKEGALYKSYDKLRDIRYKIDEIDCKEWTVTHSLAYLCERYQEKFDEEFVFGYDNVLSKSAEYRLMSRIWLINQATSGKGELVKNYIDWFFMQYKSSRRFSSIGALAKVDLHNKYKDFIKKSTLLTANTKLPQKYLDIIKKVPDASYITTYGDLYFFIEGSEKSVIENMIVELKNNGLDTKTLIFK